MKPVSAVELYKATPMTNCRECGYSTCLAFATLVIVEKKPLEACPYLGDEKRKELKSRIMEQQSQGVYVKRDQYKITADHIRDRLKDYDFSAVAKGLGADFLQQDGRPFLRFRYLNRDCLLSKQEIFWGGSPTEDHWHNILLYNYVYFAGSEPLQGEWIPIDNIPGNIPKKPELEQGCEHKIANHFEGRILRMQHAASALGGDRVEDATHADAAYRFLPLPKVPFYLLFWDHQPQEGFPARTKILFDGSVTNYLDVESLVFLAEKFAEALIEADSGSS